MNLPVSSLRHAQLWLVHARLDLGRDTDDPQMLDRCSLNPFQTLVDVLQQESPFLRLVASRPCRQ